jgi:hypothetical protein
MRRLRQRTRHCGSRCDTLNNRQPRRRARARHLGGRPLRFAAILALGTALCAAPVLVSATLVANAQTAQAAYKAPRLAFGHPDLQGVWSNASLTPLTRKAEFKDRLVHTPEEVKKIEGAAAAEFEEGNKPTDPNAPAELPREKNIRPEFAAAGGDVGGYNIGWLDPGHQVMRVRGEPRTSILTTPNGLPPARKAGAATPARSSIPMGSFDSYETRSLGERCVIGFGRNGGPPMLSNGFYNNNYKIVQSPDHVMIMTEMNHDARIIRLNSKHRNDDVRPYFGDSIGRWEGDTLVVETINIPQSQAFMGSWKDLKVTERFTRVAEDRVHYAFTVEDPTIWEQPWGGEYEFQPLGDVIYEYACHEGNYALPGILAGARVQEARTGKAAAPVDGDEGG